MTARAQALMAPFVGVVEPRNSVATATVSLAQPCCRKYRSNCRSTDCPAYTRTRSSGSRSSMIHSSLASSW